MSFHFEQNRPRGPPGPDGPQQANRAADGGHDGHLAKDHAANAAGRGAERHSQPDFSRPLLHRVGQDAVETDRCQEGRQHGEAGRERADDAVDGHVLADLLLHRAQVFHWQVRIYAGNDPVDPLQHHLGGAGGSDVV